MRTRAFTSFDLTTPHPSITVTFTKELNMTERIKVYVCSNHETLARHLDHDHYKEEIDDAVSEAGRMLDDAGYYSQRAGYFPDWHGGKFAGAGQVLGGKKYGYRCGNVATLAIDPSPELVAAIDAADAALDERLGAITKAAEEEEAEDAIEVDEEE
jgi:hypothetical protein